MSGDGGSRSVGPPAVIPVQFATDTSTAALLPSTDTLLLQDHKHSPAPAQTMTRAPAEQDTEAERSAKRARHHSASAQDNTRDGPLLGTDTVQHKPAQETVEFGQHTDNKQQDMCMPVWWWDISTDGPAQLAASASGPALQETGHSSCKRTSDVVSCETTGGACAADMAGMDDPLHPTAPGPMHVDFADTGGWMHRGGEGLNVSTNSNQHDNTGFGSWSFSLSSPHTSQQPEQPQQHRQRQHAPAQEWERLLSPMSPAGAVPGAHVSATTVGTAAVSMQERRPATVQDLDCTDSVSGFHFTRGAIDGSLSALQRKLDKHGMKAVGVFVPSVFPQVLHEVSSRHPQAVQMQARRQDSMCARKNAKLPASSCLPLRSVPTPLGFCGSRVPQSSQDPALTEACSTLSSTQSVVCRPQPRWTWSWCQQHAWRRGDLRGKQSQSWTTWWLEQLLCQRACWLT